MLVSPLSRGGPAVLQTSTIYRSPIDTHIPSQAPNPSSFGAIKRPKTKAQARTMIPRHSGPVAGERVEEWVESEATEPCSTQPPTQHRETDGSVGKNASKATT